MTDQADSLSEIALFRTLPALVGRLPWATIGTWPTRVDYLPVVSRRVGSEVFVKREDLSSPIYGGNKVRTLEAMMGKALAANAEEIWAVGAYGSNHALATALHAPRAGLRAGVALFPQPPSTTARDNLLATLATEPRLSLLSTVVGVPYAMTMLRRRAGTYVMAPGGATPHGALGALSAALELAQQIEAKQCPLPKQIVVAVGSGCTTAGLVAGLHIAQRLGIGFRATNTLPRVHAVRVTPWPITSRNRIAWLAHGAARVVSEALGPRSQFRMPGFRTLRRILEIDGSQYGAGYGRVTAAGRRTMDLFERADGPALDVVYSAKSAAILTAQRAPGPTVFWATKSTAPLPTLTRHQRDRIPATLAKWLPTSPRQAAQA